MENNTQLLQRFNEKLQQEELLLNYSGNNDLIITGAPAGNIIKRIIISTLGVMLVTLCLMAGTDSHDLTSNILPMGGLLLGLVLLTSPFLSFYKKKHFQIRFSKTLQVVTIVKGVLRRKQKIGFNAIDHIAYKKIEIDSYVSSETESSTVKHYKFSLICDNKSHDLFSVSSREESVDEFAEDFAQLLSQFTGKEAKIIL